MNKNLVRIPIYISIVTALSACQSTENKADAVYTDSKTLIGSSYLSSKVDLTNKGKEKLGNGKKLNNDIKETKFTSLKAMKVSQVQLSVAEDFKSTLNDENKNIKMTSDGLRLSDFIHHVFGEILSMDYILDDKATADDYTVSLSLKEDMSQLQAFNIVEDILEQRNYVLLSKNKILYIVASEEAGQSKSFSYGIGKKEQDIPKTGQEIFQIIPLLYSQTSDFSLILRSLANVNVSQSRTGNLLYIQGKKEEVAKTLEFIRLIDKPTALSANVALIELIYNGAEEFSEQLQKIMSNEGVAVGIGEQGNNASVLVPIASKGIIIAFAKTPLILERLKFWTKKLDKADSKGEANYFVYHPKFARAADLGESLSAIVNVSGGRTNGNTNSSTDSPNKATKTANRRSSSRNTAQIGLYVAIDERSNTLIVSGTGEEYQKILPIISSLDVLPKQVMLEMTLAEVTLKDDFKQGVEFAYNETNGNNNYSLGTNGALGLGAVGGFSYSLTGLNGDLQLSLSQDNNLVNILSRPSIVVRDGVTASITVGTDIPVVGATTTDPISGDRETTSIDYRKTGIELEVTPTVNSQGVVIMEINQKISNTVTGGASTEGSPSIFERSIKTEVVASSGQTIILGGLISENTTTSISKVPILGDIPLLGKLFSVEGDLKDKTELVVLVTPRIIQREDEWQNLKTKFFNALDNLKLQGDTSPVK